MKLANLGGRAVLVTPDRTAIDIATATNNEFGPDLLSCYERWDELAAAEISGDAKPIDEARLGSPSPNPRQVFGIGLNYAAHAAESGAQIPSMPATFTKFPTCLTGPYADVVLPSASVDWEVELVVIIGRRAAHVSEDNGWAHVAGLTVGQDLSERRVQMAAGAQFSLGKSFPGFGPMGPWLVTPDELDDPDDLALGCSIDGEVMQDARTNDLVYGVPRLVAELSAIVSLLPGDVIFTGTPAGVGMGRKPPRFLEEGEVLESWIEGIGTIRNRMIGTPA